MVGQSSPIRNGKLGLQLFICTNIVAKESKIESPNMKLVSGPTLTFKPRGFKGRLALAQVLPRSQLIFPSKTWFFGIYLNFQWLKSLKIQYLSHSESKSYQINSIKSCSSRSFQQHQRHIPIPPKFSAMI